MANTRKAAANPPKRDPLDIIRQAALPRRTVPVCLRGDLVAQVDELQTRLDGLSAPDRLIGNPEARQIADQIEALREQMREGTIEVHLQALPRRAYQKFMADHAPRDGNAADNATGFNTDTYFDDLIFACIVEPELPRDTFDELLDRLNIAEYRKLVEAAGNLNVDEVSVPFSWAASLLRQDSDAK